MCFTGHDVSKTVLAAPGKAGRFFSYLEVGLFTANLR